MLYYYICLLCLTRINKAGLADVQYRNDFPDAMLYCICALLNYAVSSQTEQLT
jgi:hypothetical protein